MTFNRQLIFIPFFFLLPFGNQDLEKNDLSGNEQKLSGTKQNHKNMGISINLYRLPKAERLEDIKDLENQIAKTRYTKVDLYQIASDLAVIFLNTTNPYLDQNTIPYKMLYGRKVDLSVNVGEIGGFLPSSEIPKITEWIKNNKIDTFDGFSEMYNNLSLEVKKELEEMGTEDHVILFNSYVRPLVVLYFTALENNNSIVFIGQ